ncbi:MAG: hypothetical protein KDK04_28425 [Candidatus Competibacteraceae bacterium]|nr:hypothetical protein [Candidatus Competibacteraceae bacterium]
MAHDALFEVYHPDEQRWQTVMPGYVNAFLRAGPGDIDNLLARLHAGETLEFNGWRLRQRAHSAPTAEPS